MSPAGCGKRRGSDVAYATRLALGGSLLSSAKIAASAAGVPILPLLIEALSGGAKQSAELAESAEKVFESSEQEESVGELKRSLAESLDKLDAPLLVILDDVDRLFKEEIRLLFQLIKVNADFPNVVYFQMFDRRIVEDALEGVGGEDHLGRLRRTERCPGQRGQGFS